MHIYNPRNLPELSRKNAVGVRWQGPVRARGVFGWVLSLFRPDFAALCPDLVREARMAVSRVR